MKSDKDIIGAIVIETELDANSDWIIVEKDGNKYKVSTSEWLIIESCDREGE